MPRRKRPRPRHARRSRARKTLDTTSLAHQRRAGKGRSINSPARLRSLAVLSRVRGGTTFSDALRIERTTVRTVRRYVGSALIRDPRTRRIGAKSGDTFRRDIYVLSYDGYEPVVVRSSKQAHLASEHLIAVARVLRPPGDPELLKPFTGKRVGGVELLTDPDRLQVLGDAGLVKSDGLYRQHRGAREVAL
jgi:hypothetical protein